MTIIPENLAHWNAVTPHHVGSPIYRTDALTRVKVERHIGKGFVMLEAS